MSNITQSEFERLLEQYAHDFSLACKAEQLCWLDKDKYIEIAAASRSAVIRAAFPVPQVNTIVCPVCRTGHDLPLCPERK